MAQQNMYFIYYNKARLPPELASKCCCANIYGVNAVRTQIIPKGKEGSRSSCWSLLTPIPPTHLVIQAPSPPIALTLQLLPSVKGTVTAMERSWLRQNHIEVLSLLTTLSEIILSKSNFFAKKDY